MGAESLLWFLIALAIFGLIVGAVGRLLVPGPTPLGVLGTMGAGVAGALIGGFVGRLLLGPKLTQGWIWVLSILGAALVVALVSGPRVSTTAAGRDGVKGGTGATRQREAFARSERLEDVVDFVVEETARGT